MTEYASGRRAASVLLDWRGLVHILLIAMGTQWYILFNVVAGAMYAVIAGIALAIAAARLIATPALWQSPAMALLYGASGGLLDIESFRPLSVVPPKDWFVLGSLAGYALGRLVTGPRPAESGSDGTWWLSGMAKH